MFLIKVQYTAYKNPRWVLVHSDCPEYVKSIQKSRKTATKFHTKADAERVASRITPWHSRKVEIVACF
jgi:hypothetical protein